MATNTTIEWTEATWNPITGCTKISPGCVHCYAERMAKRLKAMGQRNYRNGFEVTLHPQTLSIPLKWRKPRIIFVNSMSDLFHEHVPINYIQDVFSIMREANHHIFQVLTKRSSRLVEVSEYLKWSKNIWMGVSVENNDYVYRVDNLRQTEAHTKFISFEPLLSKIQEVNLHNINWVIVGGESGPKSRPMRPEWVTDLRDKCITSNVPFFFKQWGGLNKKKNGRVLEGKTWNEIPSYATLAL